MTIDDGGPAFPPMHNPLTHDSGMSLRDYFAAAAMNGEVGHPDSMGDTKEIAKFAYLVADAMLKARLKPTDGDSDD